MYYDSSRVRQKADRIREQFVPRPRPRIIEMAFFVASALQYCLCASGAFSKYLLINCLSCGRSVGGFRFHPGWFCFSTFYTYTTSFFFIAADNFEETWVSEEKAGKKSFCSFRFWHFGDKRIKMSPSTFFFYCSVVRFAKFRFLRAAYFCVFGIRGGFSLARPFKDLSCLMSTVHNTLDVTKPRFWKDIYMRLTRISISDKSIHVVHQRGIFTINRYHTLWLLTLITESLTRLLV